MALEGGECRAPQSHGIDLGRLHSTAHEAWSSLVLATDTYLPSLNSGHQWPIRLLIDHDVALAWHVPAKASAPSCR